MTTLTFILVSYLTSVICCYSTFLYLSRKEKANYSNYFSVCFVPVVNLLPFLVLIVIVGTITFLDKKFTWVRKTLNGEN